MDLSWNDVLKLCVLMLFFVFCVVTGVSMLVKKED